MKGFIKGCGVAALVLIILGTALLCIGAATKGTENVKEIVRNAVRGSVVEDWDWNDYDYDYDYDYEYTYPEEVSEACSTMVEGNYKFDIEDASDYSKQYEVYKGDFDLTLPSQGVTELDLGLGGCVLRILESDSSDIVVKAVNTGKAQAYISEGTFYLISTRKADVWEDIDKCQVDLYIPRGTRFEDVTIDLGAGVMSLGNLSAREMELNVGAGILKAGLLEAVELDVTVGAGEIIIEEIIVQELSATVDAGMINISGSAQSVDADCAMGTMELLLDGSWSDFDYVLECMAGNINIDGKNYAALMQTKEIYNGTGREIDLECAMGNINIDFR